MTSTVAAILWRRLDTSGHDACRLLETGHGWMLEGRAVFLHEEQPAALAYSVTCDVGWKTQSASISGFLGVHTIDVAILRAGNGWLLNGAGKVAVTGETDLDLGFTPATNLIALRRLELPIGEAAPAPAAYLQFPQLELTVLEQRYRRLDAHRYDYEAPSFGYHDVLEVGNEGFVTNYPNLWKQIVASANDGGTFR